MNQLLEVPTTNDLSWLQHQLKNVHGLEREKEEIWFAVFNDAGRDRNLAEQMVDSLNHDQGSLKQFALSLQYTSPKVVVPRMYQGWSNWEVAAFLVSGIAIGACLMSLVLA